MGGIPRYSWSVKKIYKPIVVFEGCANNVKILEPWKRKYIFNFKNTKYVQWCGCVPGENRTDIKGG